MEQQEIESLYQTKFVRAVLEYQLPPIKWTIIKKLLIPYLVYLGLFNFYAVYYFERRMDSNIDNTFGEAIQYFGSQLILLVLTFYFLWNALRQLGGNQTFWRFITNVWNIIDIVPCLLVSTSISITYVQSTSNSNDSLIWQRYLNSISSFFLWMKLFYFFRVFRNFSHMIKTIINVLSDM